ncbi:MAG TPA: hypothetical protein VFO58_13195 [Vicinamibacterales bacterium]|nr:hypothetical protein [Vicinamibacterales bacterium]
MRKFVMHVVTAAVLLVPSSLYAQDDPAFGLVTGYPANIGVIWHVSERVAVRPDFNFTWFSTEGAFSDSDTTAIGIGISVLFYARATDQLRLYFVPRFGYGRTSTSTPNIDPTETTQGSGSFGAQYSLHRRFAVFGEAGVLFSHATGEFTTSSNSWGTRTGVGVIVYF